jgi:hypothetical protein
MKMRYWAPFPGNVKNNSMASKCIDVKVAVWQRLEFDEQGKMW